MASKRFCCYMIYRGAPITPLPMPLTTPPETKIYFVIVCRTKGEGMANDHRRVTAASGASKFAEKYTTLEAPAKAAVLRSLARRLYASRRECTSLSPGFHLIKLLLRGLHTAVIIYLSALCYTHTINFRSFQAHASPSHY